MWVPEPLTHFLLAATDKDLTSILDFIGKEGKFHISEFSHRYLKEPEYKEMYFKFEEYERRIKEIIEYFDIEIEEDILFDTVELSEVAERAEVFLRDFQEKLGHKKDRLIALKKEEDELNLTSELLSLLPEAETNIEELHNSDFLKMIGGTIPASEEENLLEIIEDRDILVFRRKVQNDYIPIIIFYSFFEESSIGDIFKEVHFKKLELFSNLEGPLSGLKDKVENKFWEIKEERTSLKASIKKMGRDFQEDLLKLKKNIEISKLELNWVAKTARSDRVFFISAYLPTNVVPEIKEKSTNLELYVLVEEDMKRNHEAADRTPTKLNNPLVFRPFESLVKSYGVPSYKGIDPTIFTTLSFIFFFGIMFGDLGHGLVLILAAIAFYFIKALRRFAVFSLALGVSSSIFGTFFGEFFGMHPFKALWFSPLEDPQRAMLFAVYLGIIMITVGFVIRLVEFTMENNKEELFLSGHGLPGLIFYISTLAFAFSIINGKTGGVIVVEVLGMGISALLVAGGIPLKSTIIDSKSLNSNKLLLSLGELIHLSLTMISNTLSFIRIAAFSIAHVILTMAVIEIAEAFGDLGGIGKYSTLIFGNVLIMIFEGMVVFIQGLRLEYYELYSRFFEEGKEMFESVKISRR